MTAQPGSFSQCLPRRAGPRPYLVPAGCISLCCSHCPVCTARHLAAVWRKQPPLSIPPCSFHPSVPPASTESIFLEGYTAQLQPEPCPYTASQPRLCRQSRKKGVIYSLQANAFIYASSLLCLIVSKGRKLKWMLPVFQQNRSLHIAHRNSNMGPGSGFYSQCQKKSFPNDTTTVPLNYRS